MWAWDCVLGGNIMFETSKICHFWLPGFSLAKLLFSSNGLSFVHSSCRISERKDFTDHNIRLQIGTGHKRILTRTLNWNPASQTTCTLSQQEDLDQCFWLCDRAGADLGFWRGWGGPGRQGMHSAEGTLEEGYGSPPSKIKVLKMEMVWGTF